MDRQKFSYRKQYVLGSKYIDGFMSWQRIEIGDGYYLTAHPELEVTKVALDGSYMFLLGYILDPNNTRDTNSQVIQKVIAKVKAPDDVFGQLAEKCGRYVLIVKTDKELRIFSDAAGMRQIFYYTDAADKFWCASQPHILAEQFKLSVDETIRSDFNNTLLFASESNYWYPGSCTLFKEIHHLMPNHYLDLKNNVQNRYWPSAKLSSMTTDECAEKSSALLSGIIESACFRFNNLALAISSGLDSRLLLAASKKHADKIKYFTHIHHEASNNDMDLSIPSMLCKKLHLHHRYINQVEAIDGEFENAFKENVFTARRSTMSDAYAIYEHFGVEKEDLTVIYGNCAEITKRDRSRYPKLPNFLITGKSVTEMALLSHSSTALHEFETWLSTVKYLATKYKFDVLDLLHWEHRVGSWASMSFQEYEMAFEVICPYSCRQYIEYLLSVPFKYRTKPDYIMQHKIAQTLWPQTLDLPINPVNSRFKKAIGDLLYKTDMYDALKYVFMMYHRRYKVPLKKAGY